MKTNKILTTLLWAYIMAVPAAHASNQDGSCPCRGPSESPESKSPESDNRPLNQQNSVTSPSQADSLVKKNDHLKGTSHSPQQCESRLPDDY